MALSQILLPDENTARKKILRSLGISLRLLTIIGKPPYFLLFLTLSFIAYLVNIMTSFPLSRAGSPSKRGRHIRVQFIHGRVPVVFLKSVIRYTLLIKLPKFYSGLYEKLNYKEEVIYTSVNVKRKELSTISRLKNIYQNTLKATPLTSRIAKFQERKKYIIGSTKNWIFKHFKGLHKALIKVKENYKKLLWKTHVFFLAVQKFLGKILKYSKVQTPKILSKTSPFFLLLKLRLKLKLIYLSSLIPHPKPIKISKLSLLTYFLTLIFVLGCLGGASFWFFILRDLPSPEILTEVRSATSTKIYDRNGILLYNIYKDHNRTPVPISKIPKNVILATLASEDAEFYSHPGFSIKGIARAVKTNLQKDNITGGSTITQQLVKNTLLSPEKTLIRKLKEIVLAVEVEIAFDKDKILEMYLNEVSYGGTTYGIQEAAKTYFNKDVAELTLAEAAFLAGLPKSPTALSPFGSNPESGIARQKEVLRLMESNGFITKDQLLSASSENFVLANLQIPIKAPHFVFYVRDNLESKYGKEFVESGGLDVTTTLDYKIQELAERVIREEIDKLKALNVGNAAALVLKPTTGEILSMVGSYDYFDSKIDGNVNVVTRPRQPGSSIKVVNYAYALSNGYTAATLIPDSLVTFLIDGQPPYTPKNYEGDYRGNLTLRNALAESRNIPAVRVLASYGVKNMLDQGKKMGITTWNNPDNYGLSLTLGGGEVKLIDLAQVYATLANYGKTPELNSILKITTPANKILEEGKCATQNAKQTKLVDLVNPVQASSEAKVVYKPDNSSCTGTQVLDPRVAFIITDILRDNVARTPSFGANSLLVVPKHTEVAVKTGTSNDLRDNLAVGYTEDYLVAVWVGNNDGSPMQRIASGITGATPIFNKIMSALLAEEDNKLTSVGGRVNWSVPEKLVQLPICPYTGTLACNGCPTKLEWFLEENQPEKKCSPEWFEENQKPQENQEIIDNTESQNQIPPVDPKSQSLIDYIKKQIGEKQKPPKKDYLNN